MIPNRDQWESYLQGNMLESNDTMRSIRMFQTLEGRQKLEEREQDDLSDHEIDRIYREISFNANERIRIQNMYKDIIKPSSAEASPSS